ncbi:DUF2306 domain-containing protein [Tsukamurella sp. 8F]|uniref:DUF2306 domain-containing protein n=1 Tax=unclassified Tsukamurella TaxID=2633480 RepID=UPI0023B960AD|nr:MULTISPECIES: DUF2306 domain-containing protein [unclassified Tsukamurella]MDF0530472.1 DUF2306 domain-containing protein [Tsukamurella sp. 8J]MDF0587707.1 DUF2306 domain-containing protein [Tsukamurella sp. 8F]
MAHNRFRSSPALGLLTAALVVIGFLAYSWPPYLSGGTRIPEDALPTWYHPLLVAHIAAGSVAMVAGLIQLGRRWLARWHRIAGRAYAICMITVPVMAIMLAAVTPFGPATAASHVTFALTTAGCTIAGVVAIRRGNVAGHRRWMLRSAALCYSIMLNRIIGPIVAIVLAGSPDEASIPPITSWLSWILPLLAVELWLELRPTVRPARRHSDHAARENEKTPSRVREGVFLSGGGGI